MVFRDGDRMQTEVRILDANKFGNFVADRRKELHMTQKDLAAKIHVTDKAVSKWERGLGLPDISTIEILADALNVSINELMKSERNVSNESEGVVKDVIQVAKDDISERQKIIIYTFAATTAFFSVLQIFMTIDWSRNTIGMYFEFPFIAVIPGALLIIYGIVCLIRGKKAKDIIPIGLILVVLPPVVSAMVYMICGIANNWIS